MTTWLLALAALGGVVAWFGVGSLLRRLPEPPGAPADKMPYGEVPTAGFRAVTAICVVAALSLSAVTVGWPTAIAWVALGTCGVVLAAIDARTTYLPGVLMQWGWGLAACGLVALGFLAGWEVAVTAVTGGALLGALFWLLWRFTGGLGFGDVKLAVLVGATTGTLGIQWLLAAALVGSLVGVGWGLVATRGYERRRQPFAYGPSLVIGPYLALLPQLILGLVR